MPGIPERKLYDKYGSDEFIKITNPFLVSKKKISKMH